MAYCVFTNCLSILGSGITPYTSLDSRSGVGMTTSVGQAAFFGSSDNVGPLGVTIQHICGNGVCRVDFTSTRYGVSGNDLSLNVDSVDPNTVGGLYIKYQGNVGIGTSNPSLHNGRGFVVRGTGADKRGIIELHDGCTTRNGKSVFQQVEGDTYIGQLSRGTGEGRVYFLTGGDGANATVSMTILCAGNVGIGTTSPRYRLDVAGGMMGNFYMSCCNATLDGNGPYDYGVVGTGNIAGALLVNDIVGARYSIAAGSYNLTFRKSVRNTVGACVYCTVMQFVGTTDTNCVVNVSITNSLGINTTSPSAKLSVEGSATDVENVARFNNQVNCTTRVWLRNSNHSAYWGLSSTSTADPIATGTSAGAMTLGFGNNFPIQFWNGSSASVKMTIASDGNVGIGTSSPSTVLDIRGCNTDNAVTVRNFCGDSYSAIGYVNCQGTLKAAVGIGNNSAAAPFANNAYVYTPASTDFLFYIAGSERMRVRCDGNIGIATTSPSYKLHVNGTFYAAGSSIKYKEGICNYDTDSCLFMCLKPVTYQYKDEWQHLGRELKSQSQIGLIAEDVAQVMPELAVLVNEEDEKVVRNVDYEKLSVVLLKEVQKLRQEVDELKNNK